MENFVVLGGFLVNPVTIRTIFITTTGCPKGKFVVMLDGPVHEGGDSFILVDETTPGWECLEKLWKSKGRNFPDPTAVPQTEEKGWFGNIFAK